MTYKHLFAVRLSCATASDAPLKFVEEITELESFGGFKPPGAGFSFYLEDEER